MHIVVWISFLLFNSPIFAQIKCADIKSFKEFYLCSLEKHPKLEISKLKSLEGDAFVESASQWENPEVSLKSTTGQNAGERVGSTELGLAFSASQLWTRSAKKDIAEAEKKIAEVESRESMLAARRELIKDLYRLRQTDVELELVNEAITTFDKIKSQYRSRPVRGAEQEITLNLVELATSDYELKKNHLGSERSEIVSRLKAYWGPDLVLKKEYLPPLRDHWMDISASQVQGISFEVQKINIENEKALAEQKLVQRESWPALSVGPVIERTTEGPNQFNSYGINLNMTLPLVSINGGARKLADIKARQTQILADFANKRAIPEKEILVQKYKSSIESLRKSTNHNEIKNKHQKIDNLFRQGLASGGLVIEAHRQIIGYTESQHEHENSAIDAFLEIKALNGEGFEEIFQ